MSKSCLQIDSLFSYWLPRKVSLPPGTLYVSITKHSRQLTYTEKRFIFFPCLTVLKVLHLDWLAPWFGGSSWPKQVAELREGEGEGEGEGEQERTRLHNSFQGHSPTGLRHSTMRLWGHFLMIDTGSDRMRAKHRVFGGGEWRWEWAKGGTSRCKL
jgi:hypothetical protein